MRLLQSRSRGGQSPRATSSRHRSGPPISGTHQPGIPSPQQTYHPARHRLGARWSKKRCILPSASIASGGSEPGISDDGFLELRHVAHRSAPLTLCSRAFTQASRADGRNRRAPPSFKYGISLLGHSIIRRHVPSSLITSPPAAEQSGDKFACRQWHRRNVLVEGLSPIRFRLSTEVNGDLISSSSKCLSELGDTPRQFEPLILCHHARISLDHFYEGVQSPRAFR